MLPPKIADHTAPIEFPITVVIVQITFNTKLNGFKFEFTFVNIQVGIPVPFNKVVPTAI